MSTPKTPHPATTTITTYLPPTPISLAQIPLHAKLPITKDGHPLLAEILAKREGLYYVHYCEYNKRLDEWVDANRMDTNKVEMPVVKVILNSERKGGDKKMTTGRRTIKGEIKQSHGTSPLVVYGVP
jgi:hypothetical protein